MLCAARVRRMGYPDRAALARAGAVRRDKRKSKHPEDAFSVQVASGNSTHAFCILSCWLAIRKSEQILGRIPCYGMVQDAFSGSFDSPSVSRYDHPSMRKPRILGTPATRESLGVAQDDRG